MKYCYGNWKMNTTLALADVFEKVPTFKNVEMGIAPSFPYIPIFKERISSQIKIGAQNCSNKTSGAFTGEVAAKMLKELNIDFIILGHSERRHQFGETNCLLKEKLKICKDEKLKIVFCVGETLKQREANETFSVIKEQLKVLDSIDDVIIAYEPVWAINTGVAAKKEDVKEAVDFIKSELKIFGESFVLYGGSVNSKNASDFVSLCDGFLVGNASLNDGFFEIAKSLEN